MFVDVEMVEHEMFILSRRAGLLIGRKGVTINAIIKETGIVSALHCVVKFKFEIT